MTTPPAANPPAAPDTARALRSTGTGVPAPAARSRPADLQLAERLARWLDVRWLDPIIGLVAPGVGDIATAGAGLYMVLVAARRRLPLVVLARMLLNLSFDVALGAIPVVGDVADVFYRANQRNLRLLQARYHSRRAGAGDYAVVGGAVLLFATALALPVIALVALLGAWLG
jgi:hypothetical protein